MVRCLLYKGAAGQSESLAGRSARSLDGPATDFVRGASPGDGPGTGTGDGHLPPVLAVSGLTVRFKLGAWWSKKLLHAVDDVSFTVAPREIVALVGESGSGKSTVARTLAMVYQATGGQVHFEGRALSSLARRRDKVAYRGQVPMVFQDPYSSLNPAYRVSHGIMRAIELHRPEVAKADRRAEAVRVMDAVGLHPAEQMLSRFPYELSGGQRQRVGFAQALALRPKLILADEPVSMLDVSIRVGLLNMMAALREREGVSILYITHDLASARYIADRVIVMYAGHVAEVGPTEQLLGSPRHPYTQLLLSAVPDPRAPLEQAGVPDAGEPPKVVNPAPGCLFQPRCPFAVDICREVTPALAEVAPGQFAACHVAIADARRAALSGPPTRAGTPSERAG